MANGTMVGGIYIPAPTTKTILPGSWNPTVAYPQHEQIVKDLGISPPPVTTRDLTRTKDTAVKTAAAEVIPAGGDGSASGFPDFSVDLEGIWETAGIMADNEIDPQLREIDRLLQDAGYTADESTRAINEAYPIARRSIQKSIYENFVAGEGRLAGMGTGRGGGRQELLGRAGTREAVGIEGIETAKTRELGAIGRALSKYTGQLGTERVGLEGSRGNLQNIYSEQLRGNRFNEAGVVYGAAVDKYAADRAFVSPSGSSVADATGTLLGITNEDLAPYLIPANEATIVPFASRSPLEQKLWGEWKDNYRYRPSVPKATTPLNIYGTN